MMTSQQQIQRQAVLTVAHQDFEKGLNVHAFLKLGNHALGEGLVQDSFMKTWMYLVRGGKIEVMKAFLYHVLNGLIVDEYRKHAPLSLDALLEKSFEPSIDHSKRLFNILDGKSALLLIQRITHKYQKVMRMRYLQHLSLNEMALLSGQSKNAIAVQAHRGLGKLRLLYNAV